MDARKYRNRRGSKLRLLSRGEKAESKSPQSLRPPNMTNERQNEMKTLQTTISPAASAREQTLSARKAAFPIAAAIVLSSDAITKSIALNWETTQYNTGAGDHVSWFVGGFPVAFVAAVAVTLVTILIYWCQIWKTLPVHIGAGITAGGIAGNLADKLFRADNGIIDWLAVPISENLTLLMNIADICVLTGIALFMSAAINNIRKDRQNSSTARNETKNLPSNRN